VLIKYINLIKHNVNRWLFVFGHFNMGPLSLTLPAFFVTSLHISAIYTNIGVCHAICAYMYKIVYLQRIPYKPKVVTDSLHGE